MENDMKNFLFVCVLAASIFLGCKNDGKKSGKIAVSKNCEIEYAMDKDGKTLSAISISNGDRQLLVSWDDDGSSFHVEDDESLSCTVNVTDWGLCSYQVSDDRLNYGSAVNVLKSGEVMFKLDTPVYKETVNAYVEQEGYAMSQVVMNDGTGFLMKLENDGKYNVESWVENR